MRKKKSENIVVFDNSNATEQYFPEVLCIAGQVRSKNIRFKKDKMLKRTSEWLKWGLSGPRPLSGVSTDFILFILTLEK